MAVRSLYSDISKRMIASLVPNISSANCLASSVLPTPVGPTKRKLPIGRLPSSKHSTVTTDSTSYSFYCLVLADYLVFQAMIHIFQTFDVRRPICDTEIPVIRSTDSATSLMLAVTFMSSVWFRLFSLIQQYVFWH